ncbi:MAG: phosphate ABC transporter substrate-binding protein PstS [Bdellovibrionaceae bacterium]|nr:phosphate ABC transporter substrate-binding protein PstS [Pseudobdellovibrionaceae bacterium]
MKKIRLSFLILIFFSFISCFSKNKRLLINGAGASFPYILYSKWITEYHDISSDVAINYQSIGSGGGIRQLLAGTLDFGGTDIPVSKEEQKLSKKEILHIPTALGAVALTYNVPSLKEKELKMTGELLAEIFIGKIKNWNDPKIKKWNPNLNFPSLPIVIIYRADGSGTTSFFTEFLSIVSPSFLKTIGKGKSVSWLVGVGGKGNEGVMGLVNKMEGALAYISLSYAMSQKLPVMAIQNKEKKFVRPNLKTIQAAAQQSLKRNQAYTSSLIYTKGKNSYPISGYTYLILPKKMSNKKGVALVEFLKWALSKGQSFTESLYFISLPPSVVKSALEQLSLLELD